MSVPVELSNLAQRIDEYGDVAYLVTVGSRGGPHVVAVRVRIDNGVIAVHGGDHTVANARSRPDVTLVWSALPATGYCLIVDGTAVPVEGDPAVNLGIRPTASVLHRTPDGDPSAPMCVTVLERASQR